MNIKSWMFKFAVGVVFAGLFQTAALAWMVFDRVSLLQNGREVVLQTIPVDPRDLFRGDYVILNYEAGALDLKALGGDDKFASRAAVYVVLEPETEKLWKPVSVHLARPEILPQQVVIKGTARNAASAAKPRKLRVNYGVGRLFVPEGEGKALEKEVRKGDVFVVLAVAKDGEAAVKAMLVNGERVYEETLF